MPAARLTPIPYPNDSTVLFDSIVQLPWSIMLDSGSHPQGRYDILVADPYLTLTTHQHITEIYREHAHDISHEDPLLLIKRYLGKPVTPLPEVPFCGGAIGYLSYDLGHRLSPIRPVSHHPIPEHIPDMAIGLYDWAVVIDHQAQRAWLVGQGKHPATFNNWDALVTHFQQDFSPEHYKPLDISFNYQHFDVGMMAEDEAHCGEMLKSFRHQPDTPPVIRQYPPFQLQEALQANMTQAEYAKAFEKIQAYLYAGDCYQVNFAQRFVAAARGHPWEAYRRLRKLSPAPYGAFMRSSHGTVLCNSPEVFLTVSADGEVETKPIKGTCKRDPDPAVDKARIAALLASPKEQAENLMIVDLLRNDLSKTCELFSVQVPKLWDIESFASVHHLVSTIAGKLQADKHALDALRGCFPGGSPILPFAHSAITMGWRAFGLGGESSRILI